MIVKYCANFFKIKPVPVLLALSLYPSLSFAAGFYTWTGTETNEDGWNLEVSNWDTGSVPSSADDVSLNGTVSATGNAISMYRLFMGTTSLAKLTISNGTANSIAQDAYIGNAASQNGFLYLENSGTSLTVGNLNVGRYGIGTVEISDGATLSVSGSLIIALKANSTGTLNIGSAAGKTASTAGFLNADSITFDPTGSASASSLVLNHTNTDYQLSQNLVDSTGNSNIYLYSGTTSFTGTTSSYGGTMNVNGGTLSIADDKTLSLGGNYIQTSVGTLKLGVLSNASYGKLSIAGTATFANGAKLDVDVKNQDSITNGALLTDVITAGTLNANSFNVTDNSALYNFAAEINGNAVDLSIEKDNGAGVLKSVNSEGFTSGRGAARVLDGFVNGRATGTDIDNVTTALGQLSNDQEITEAVAETLPLLVGGTTKLAANTLHSTNRVIQSRQANTRGLSSGDAFLIDKNMWLKPVGSWTRQQERNGVSGYDADSYGFVVGMDGDVTSSSRLGLALSYMNTRVDGNGMSSGNKADIDAYQLIAYGSHDLAQFENVELNWQADVGMNKNDSKRQISFIGRTAEADYDSYTAHVGVGVGKRFELNENSTVMPSIRADYAYIRDESYTEKGAGAISLDVDSVHTDEFILMAQTDIDHQLNDKTTLLANMGIGYDLINDDTSMTASYTGGGTAFTTEGIDPSPWLARAGVGATVNINDYTDITAQYDVEGREDFLNQTASVKLRLSF